MKSGGIKKYEMKSLPDQEKNKKVINVWEKIYKY